MRIRSVGLFPVVLLAAGVWNGSRQAAAPAESVPVSMVVSVEAVHGNDIPDVARQDVKVYGGKEELQMTGWTPLKDEQAGLEFYIVVDDSIETTIGLQLKDLAQFINDQPPTAAVGVGYVKGGAIVTAQAPTRDHALAARALRPSTGLATADMNPYQAIVDLIHRWPAGAQRREILLISDGINPSHGGPNDSSLDSAIADAQGAGIQIYCVTAPAGGHLGHSMRLGSVAELKLSELVDETGGELYAQAFSFHMDRLAQRLQHQYRISFLVKPQQQSGYKDITLETKTPNAELVSATKVYVPAAK